MLPFGFFRVSGESMLPTYRPGDLLLGRVWFLKPKIGDVVVALVENRLLIKRIAFISGNKFEVIGDNPVFSTDSRSFGLISMSSIRAKIITRISSSP